jgi:hypothetical protein
MFVSTSPACLNYYFRVVRHYKALLDSPHAAVACLWDGFEELWKASLVATAVGKGDTVNRNYHPVSVAHTQMGRAAVR